MEVPVEVDSYRAISPTRGVDVKVHGPGHYDVALDYWLEPLGWCRVHSHRYPNPYSRQVHASTWMHFRAGDREFWVRRSGWSSSQVASVCRMVRRTLLPAAMDAVAGVSR
jgi:hypothetical protein